MDIVNRVLRNGRVIDTTMTESAVDAQYDSDDDDMGVEPPNTRRLRYRNSSQDEVSDPDERADLHYDGHLDAFDNERTIGFSRANSVRLERARATLMARHDDAANQGNGEDAANFLRALREVEALMDIAEWRCCGAQSMRQRNGCDRPSEPIVQACESGQPANGNQNLVRTESLENDLKCMAMMVANQRFSPRVGCHILVTPPMCRQ